MLLGRPAPFHLLQMEARPGGRCAARHDTPVSYVLGIYKALQVVFKSPAHDAWVSRPNDVFGGGSALDRMLGGDVTDLAAVRRYLDTVRGQGA